MNKDVYFEYNPWWEGDFSLENIFDRPLILDRMEKYLDSPVIIFLTGLRRIGKTTLLKLFISRLLGRGIDPKTIFYVSLDDYLLEEKSIIDIVDDYRQVQKLEKSCKIFLFLDEVGHKERFQQQLKNLYDKNNAKIFATSSSATVLRDKKAMLTGREVVIEVLPLDFSEYLDFKEVSIKKRDKPLLEAYFEDFLQTGGIPGYVLSGDREYIQTLLDDIIYKDIIAFYNIRNNRLIKDFFHVSMEHSCGPSSAFKISKLLNICSETAARYLDYFVDRYLLYLVPRWGTTNVMLSSPKKIYAPDIGIRKNFTVSALKGEQFENYVFLKIKHTEPAYILENDTEIDFMIDNRIIAEIKYQIDLKPAQKVLFDRFEAKEKIVVTNLDDIARLENLLQK